MSTKGSLCAFSDQPYCYNVVDIQKIEHHLFHEISIYKLIFSFHQSHNIQYHSSCNVVQVMKRPKNCFLMAQSPI